MPHVDVQFPVHGTLIPVDHGYHLFSAASQIIPALHGDAEMGIHPMSGTPMGNRCQAITERSCLTIRLPAERIKEVLPLAGKALNLGEHTVRVGVPYTRALIPSPRLHSRLVIIKGFTEPEPFLEAVQRQLSALEVQGKASLIEQAHAERANQARQGGSHSTFLRRTIRIRDKEIVGFAVKLSTLTAEESMLVQERGIGGRRRFGCGIFVPIRRGG